MSHLKLIKEEDLTTYFDKLSFDEQVFRFATEYDALVRASNIRRSIIRSGSYALNELEDAFYSSLAFEAGIDFWRFNSFKSSVDDIINLMKMNYCEPVSRMVDFVSDVGVDNDFFKRYYDVVNNSNFNKSVDSVIDKMSKYEFITNFKDVKGGYTDNSHLENFIK